MANEREKLGAFTYPLLRPPELSSCDYNKARRQKTRAVFQATFRAVRQVRSAATRRLTTSQTMPTNTVTISPISPTNEKAWEC